jgi:hypothetical protein
MKYSEQEEVFTKKLWDEIWKSGIETNPYTYQNELLILFSINVIDRNYLLQNTRNAIH